MPRTIVHETRHGRNRFVLIGARVMLLRRCSRLSARTLDASSAELASRLDRRWNRGKIVACFAETTARRSTWRPHRTAQTQLIAGASPAS